MCKDFGRQAEKVILDLDDCKTPYERMQRYLVDESTDENYVDFLAIGNRGINKKETDVARVGSMAKIFLHDRHVNVIFVPLE